VATDFARLNDVDVGDGSKGRLVRTGVDDSVGGSGDLGETDENGGEHGNQGMTSMTEPGIVDEKSNLDDDVEASVTELGEPEDNQMLDTRMKDS
jgi:hypothetical protein